LRGGRAHGGAVRRGEKPKRISGQQILGGRNCGAEPAARGEENEKGEGQKGGDSAAGYGHRFLYIKTGNIMPQCPPLPIQKQLTRITLHRLQSFDCAGKNSREDRKGHEEGVSPAP
jgi:hypothetical protein